MSLVGYKAKNHPQQVGKRGARPEIDDRATTPEVFDPLNERFRFTIDVACSEHNAKCERFYTAEDDGLAQSWAGERVWCNPPHSNLEAWVHKAWDECMGWYFSGGAAELSASVCQNRPPDRHAACIASAGYALPVGGAQQQEPQ